MVTDLETLNYGCEDRYAGDGADELIYACSRTVGRFRLDLVSVEAHLPSAGRPYFRSQNDAGMLPLLWRSSTQRERVIRRQSLSATMRQVRSETSVLSVELRGHLIMNDL